MYSGGLTAMSGNRAGNQGEGAGVREIKEPAGEEAALRSLRTPFSTQGLGVGAKPAQGSQGSLQLGWGEEPENHCLPPPNAGAVSFKNRECQTPNLSPTPGRKSKRVPPQLGWGRCPASTLLVTPLSISYLPRHRKVTLLTPESR